jgi:hypothetical protein
MPLILKTWLTMAAVMRRSLFLNFLHFLYFLNLLYFFFLAGAAPNSSVIATAIASSTLLASCA